MAVIFIDGNDLRAAEIKLIVPTLELVIEPLQTGFATAAPDPETKARDKVLAHAVASGCFAEAVDLQTMDGKSLRLELDSGNENRFCKWWRETPAQMHLSVAVRCAGGEIQVIAATCKGRIADKPAGPHFLGWDRLFVPENHTMTLAELTAAGEVVEFRRTAYASVGQAFGL
ncbi:MAG: nucleoside-triphosphatase [Myxococcales bacterium]|nr:nucleoside-triphosphatase [Myxococcales bacterium]